MGITKKITACTLCSSTYVWSWWKRNHYVPLVGETKYGKGVNCSHRLSEYKKGALLRTGSASSKSENR